jgi:LysM repeat protein
VQAAPTVDLEATSIANSALATQVSPADQASPVQTPTASPATPIPSETPVVPTSVPTITPASATLTATLTTGGSTTYVVQAGDNLFRIALRYGTTVEAVASANGIANPALISVGQSLTIPSSGAQPTAQPGAATTYVVRRGDNLYRIALRYNMGYLHLAQYNGIANPARIYVGQVLRIPSR